MKNFHVRRSSHLIVSGLVMLVAGCGGSSPTNGGSGGGGGGGGGPVMTTSVTVGDDFFNPASIRVSPGAMVTWTWAGSDLHNVVFASAEVTSLEQLQSTGSYQTAMPTTPGTYTYQCTNHSGMDGSVVVQ